MDVLKLLRVSLKIANESLVNGLDYASILFIALSIEAWGFDYHSLQNVVARFY